MAEYIKRTDAMKICEGYSQHCFHSNDSNGQDIADRILDDIVEIPTEDIVSTKAFEQVKWERDTAIKQLESYGVGFCENKELVEVVRCKDCKLSSEPKTVSRYDLYCNDYDVYYCEKEQKIVRGTHFCSYGERK